MAAVLEDGRITHDVQRKRVRKHGQERTFTYLHLRHFGHEFELTLYEANKVNDVFKSSITGKAIERASVAELEGVGAGVCGGGFLDEALELGAGGVEGGEDVKRWEVFGRLLGALEKVRQNPAYHPEEDALYHSLQVFELARERVAYDEEFLLAALLHDVGKGIDAGDHVAAGVEALGKLYRSRRGG